MLKKAIPLQLICRSIPTKLRPETSVIEVPARCAGMAIQELGDDCNFGHRKRSRKTKVRHKGYRLEPRRHQSRVVRSRNLWLRRRIGVSEIVLSAKRSVYRYAAVDDDLRRRIFVASHRRDDLRPFWRPA